MSIIFGVVLTVILRQLKVTRDDRESSYWELRLSLVPAVLVAVIVPGFFWPAAKSETPAARSLTLVEWREVVRGDPENAEARLKLMWALVDAGFIDEALTVAPAALRLNPENADARNTMGWLLNQKERFAEAVPFLDTAVRLAPDHQQAHHNRGWALLRLRRLAEADSAYVQALRVTPVNSGAQFEHGTVLFALQRYEESEQALSRAVSADSTNVRYRLEHGRALIPLNRSDEALAEFRRGERGAETASGVVRDRDARDVRGKGLGGGPGVR